MRQTPKRKICSRCLKEKDSDEFYENFKRKDGLASVCKKCAKTKSRARYAANKDAIRKQHKLYREQNSEHIAKQKKQWRLKNLEYVRKKNREWYHSNKDRAKENHRRWCQENQEHVYSQRRIWVDENRNRVQENQKRWRQKNRKHLRDYYMKNPHIFINAAARRRARIGDAEITVEEWHNLMLQYRFRCFYCDRKLVPKNRTLDHIIPLSKGGKHCSGNLIPCCRSCNSSKKDKIYPAWSGLKKLSSEKLSHWLFRLEKEIQNTDNDIYGLKCLIGWLRNTHRRFTDGTNQNS